MTMPSTITRECFPCEAWEADGGRLMIIAPTWEVSPREDFEKYLPDLKLNWSKNARTYGCLNEAPADALFRNPEILDSLASNRPHPIGADGKFLPWFKPGDHMYFAHFDLSSKKDATGVAVVHLDQIKKKFVLDLALQIPVPPGGELEIMRSRGYIQELRNRGFYFRMVTFDGWQSLESMQNLRREGIKAELLSIDRDCKAYETLYELTVTSQFDYYPYEVLMAELKGLYKHGHMYDHTENSSKDVADAVAGALYSCYLKRPMSINPVMT